MQENIESKNENIRVVVRIRPKLGEEIDMCNVCTRVAADVPQIWIGQDKAFTFDYVFDMASKQCQIYDNCVKTLVDGCFDGYNATVLAYGQTGSGKTYTMGTGFELSYSNVQKGILPRAIEHLFQNIDKRNQIARCDGLPLPEFTITAQFIEIYNEEIIDLLADKIKKRQNIRIHEDIKKGIILFGTEKKLVTSIEETLNCLKSGSLLRSTGATLMNSESSRSHAIFTLFIKQNRVTKVKVDGDIEQEVVKLTAKFNFVDLAGSERLSRTGAVGERAREGISINYGLLHLGNVIAALGDRSKKMTHIPYRDSKLTRILQDSLGGNSLTTMIACISPCDRDFVETLNTLRYANRAKNIKNKIVANQDSQTQLINNLRRQLLQLQIENEELRKGKLFVKNNGEVKLNDVYYETKMLQRELNNANIRIKALNTRLEDITNENIHLTQQINKFKMNLNNDNDDDEYHESLIDDYIKKNHKLELKLVERNQLIEIYQKQLNQNNESSINEDKSIIELNDLALVDSENEDMEDYDDNDELSKLNGEIINIDEDLASKVQLIKECEIREQRVNELKKQYEEKIVRYKNEIKKFQMERGILLDKIKKEKDDEISKAKKEEYEKKLLQLQKEIKKYKNLKREHEKILKQEASTKKNLEKCRNELLESKQQKVKLFNQIREQTNRYNKEQLKHRTMINKLAKEEHKQKIKIRNLEDRSKNQKKLLERREEEIKALKQMVNPMSQRTVGRVLKRNLKNNMEQNVREKWNIFQTKFNILVDQSVLFEMESKKSDYFLKGREEFYNIINSYENTDKDENFEFIQNCIDNYNNSIKEIQNNIAQYEISNEPLVNLINSLNSAELPILAIKLIDLAKEYAISFQIMEKKLNENKKNTSNIVQENIFLTEKNKLLQEGVNLKIDENHLANNSANKNEIRENEILHCACCNSGITDRRRIDLSPYCISKMDPI